MENTRSQSPYCFRFPFGLSLSSFRLFANDFFKAAKPFNSTDFFQSSCIFRRNRLFQNQLILRPTNFSHRPSLSTQPTFLKPPYLSTHRLLSKLHVFQLNCFLKSAASFNSANFFSFPKPQRVSKKERFCLHRTPVRSNRCFNAIDRIARTRTHTRDKTESSPFLTKIQPLTEHISHSFQRN